MSSRTVPPRQIVMEGDNARARLTDPVTSHEAADGTADRVKESQSAVYSLLATLGDLADFELITHLEGQWSPSRVRTARHELVELGVVADSGQFRKTPSNFRAKVWQVAA